MSIVTPCEPYPNSMGDVNLALGKTWDDPVALDDPDVRGLGDKPSGEIGLGDIRCKPDRHLEVYNFVKESVCDQSSQCIPNPAQHDFVRGVDYEFLIDPGSTGYLQILSAGSGEVAIRVDNDHWYVNRTAGIFPGNTYIGTYTYRYWPDGLGVGDYFDYHPNETSVTYANVFDPGGGVDPGRRTPSDFCYPMFEEQGDPNDPMIAETVYTSIAVKVETGCPGGVPGAPYTDWAVVVVEDQLSQGSTSDDPVRTSDFYGNGHEVRVDIPVGINGGVSRWTRRVVIRVQAWGLDNRLYQRDYTFFVAGHDAPAD